VNDIDLTEAIEAGAKALMRRRDVERDHRECGSSCSYRHDVREALTAATPLIVAQVRAQIAADVDAQVSAFHGASKSTVLRIVRGDS
jgi:hypothetical protein